MSAMASTDERLQALEIKAAYAEDLLDELNLALYRQQQLVERLQQELGELRRRVPDGDAGPRNLRDELPPHY
ncbi:SlyX family protein [Pulveribacter suum]|uniref:SlyX protein n=1 Tax=Pulveribacter suum TaxID=2116657 RepID=A0A2P1NL82_9BURK|nr:SlyX family protein [Pulveribacter suum]AVP57801.1 SlyX protein [Pulveribacter suum]